MDYITILTRLVQSTRELLPPAALEIFKKFPRSFVAGGFLRDIIRERIDEIRDIDIYIPANIRVVGTLLDHNYSLYKRLGNNVTEWRHDSDLPIQIIKVPHVYFDISSGGFQSHVIDQFDFLNNMIAYNSYYGTMRFHPNMIQCNLENKLRINIDNTSNPLKIMERVRKFITEKDFLLEDRQAVLQYLQEAIETVDSNMLLGYLTGASTYENPEPVPPLEFSAATATWHTNSISLDTSARVIVSPDF